MSNLFNGRPEPKRKEYRNKKILKACHDPHLVCQVQLPGCHAIPTEPAHSNCYDDGKAGSQKADDIFVAISCRHCHDALDGRKRIKSELVDFNRDLLTHYHDRAIKRSIRIFIDKGVIK